MMIARMKKIGAGAEQTNLHYLGLIDILGIVESLCYPLPEHPHRQHVFSLTTRIGDTYCFQVNPSFFLVLHLIHRF